ncbi:hypothetical protein DVA67_003300 [Solirubrobacter sp. CPCC 204708]|uniref:TPM domain-containing protein n=1 Tax=Solirubrobacter deserti TaxID=2282478 RepID=A0ABT4RNM7_9ACTN|nr:hypothetical protein [Solirubrobacter deserti]MBE2314985.1 hypothetical protein [Solirubrobacter deserti]MDA0139900.1 hypothetical protein [Solirubrobacter deserti]
MRAALLGAVLSLAVPAVAAAQTVQDAASALRSDHVYVAEGAELAGQVDADALRNQIGDQQIFVAVLPESAVDGSAGRTLGELRQAVGESGRYALVVGDELRTIPAEEGLEARAAHPDDLQAALTQFLDESESAGGGAGGAIAAIVAGLVLLGVIVGGTLLVVNRRRERASDGRSEVGQINQTDDFVRLGDQIRALELDVTLGEAGRRDYDRALDAYTRANDLQRRGDEAGANRALDEGLAAIASARERIAGR